MLWGDEEYNSTNEMLTLGSNIKSVMFPSGNDWWMDLYVEEDCYVDNEEHPYFELATILHDTHGKNDCVDIHRGQVKSVKFGQGPYESPVGKGYTSCAYDDSRLD